MTMPHWQLLSSLANTRPLAIGGGGGRTTTKKTWNFPPGNRSVNTAPALQQLKVNEKENHICATCSSELQVQLPILSHFNFQFSQMITSNLFKLLTPAPPSPICLFITKGQYKKSDKNYLIF